MYKALRSFVGTVSAGKGQIIELKDKAIIKDLLDSGFIEEVKPAKAEKEVKKPTKKTK